MPLNEICSFFNLYADTFFVILTAPTTQYLWVMKEGRATFADAC